MYRVVASGTAMYGRGYCVDLPGVLLLYLCDTRITLAYLDKEFTTHITGNNYGDSLYRKVFRSSDTWCTPGSVDLIRDGLTRKFDTSCPRIFHIHGWGVYRVHK